MGVEHDLINEFVESEFAVYAGNGSTRHDDMLDCLANLKHPDVMPKLMFPKTNSSVGTLGSRSTTEYRNRARSVLFR